MDQSTVVSPARRRHRCAAVVVGLLAVVAVTGPVAACADPPPDPLVPLVGLVEQRLATADAVAGAKWHTGGAIADPGREQAVLAAARTGATTRGLDPERVAAFFRDQIEANKVVQYGLFSDWSAHPEHAPANAPDLARIRPELDQLTTELLDSLAATRDARAGAGCPADVRGVVEDAGRRTSADPVHRAALDRATASVC